MSPSASSKWAGPFSDGFVTLEEFKKLAELREKFQEKKQDKE